MIYVDPSGSDAQLPLNGAAGATPVSTTKPARTTSSSGGSNTALIVVIIAVVLALLAGGGLAFSRRGRQAT